MYPISEWFRKQELLRSTIFLLLTSKRFDAIEYNQLVFCAPFALYRCSWILRIGISRIVASARRVLKVAMIHFRHGVHDSLAIRNCGKKINAHIHLLISLFAPE